ncbi:hypothetical protein D9757_011413 [Collybiopsis confluens]|uniref:Uncharacterized protein n=1 Tax=Collybiopsis confluens TaxID=2823264 RepID=A0A8H5LKA3_9AGAR|nr:hypothetical protein D9757_011413 [Collybiopsis confluens]
MTSSFTPLSSVPGGLTLSERRRLVRSTRKRDFLGTTPNIHTTQLGNSVPQSLSSSASREVPSPTLFLPPPRRHSFEPPIPPVPSLLSPSPNAETFAKAPAHRRVRSFAKVSRVLGTDSYSQSVSHPLPSNWRAAALPSTLLSSGSLTQEFEDGSSPQRKSQMNSVPKLKKRSSTRNRKGPGESHGSSSSANLPGQPILPPPPPPHAETLSLMSTRSGYREEKVWRGEWNRDSIRDVIEELRGLKSRV